MKTPYQTSKLNPNIKVIAKRPAFCYNCGRILIYPNFCSVCGKDQ